MEGAGDIGWKGQAIWGGRGRRYRVEGAGDMGDIG